jgi:hypothetical protein
MKWTHKAAFLAALFFFNGCSISETGVPVDEIASEIDECEESGSENCSIDGSSVQLELFINTPKPIDPSESIGSCGGVSHNKDTASAINKFTYCFDISGTCNEAGLESAVVVARTSLDGFSTSNIVGTCKRGRFHVQVQQVLTSCANHVAKRFDINHKFCAQHTIELELVGKKADGTEVRNQARAKKTIPFVVKQRPECNGSPENTFTASCL